MRADPDPKAPGQTYDLDGTGQNPSHVQNTIVPYDRYVGQDGVFSCDLRHIFNLAANKGVHVTALFDSCHSGSIARGPKPGERGGVRSFKFDPRPMPPDPSPPNPPAPRPRSAKTIPSSSSPPPKKINPPSTSHPTLPTATSPTASSPLPSSRPSNPSPPTAPPTTSSSASRSPSS